MHYSLLYGRDSTESFRLHRDDTDDVDGDVHSDRVAEVFPMLELFSEKRFALSATIPPSLDLELAAALDWRDRL